MNGILTELQIFISCGGTGSRLWPASNSEKPKQFLSFDGKNDLLNLTISRLQSIDLPKKIILSSAASMKSFLPSGYPRLLDPVSRDTAGVFISAALATPEEDYFLVIPSDHYIPKEENELFVQTIKEGLELAQREQQIVIFGVKPTYPETGYGYLEKSSNSSQVLSFKEKPSLEVAQEYLENPFYYWNSGMILAQAKVFIQACQESCPEILSKVQAAFEKGSSSEEESSGEGEEFSLDLELYQQVPKISIDFALLEKTSCLSMIPCHLAWSDVGNWYSISQIFPSSSSFPSPGKEGEGEEKSQVIESSDVYLYRERGINQKPLFICGCSDLAVIETSNVMMVMPLSRAQDLKNYLKQIPKQFH